MKKLVVLLFVLSSGLSAFGQGSQYINAMKAAVAQVDTAQSGETLIQLGNQFQRIAEGEQKEWLPYYYSAYCIARSAFVLKKKSKLDDYLDNAEGFARKADSLSPNNSEIYALKAMIYQGRIAVNPMSRGKKFGTLANEMGQKALDIDSTNPRPYVLKGTGLFYTPAMFGGGKNKARPVLETAVKKLDAFKPASDIAPHWGREQAQRMLDECNK